MKNFLARLEQWLSRGHFGAKVITLVNANVLAQGLSIIFIPVLTRLYDPADFGMLAAYTALISILAVGVAARYDIAIPLASKEPEAINLVALSLTIVVGLSLLTGILLWIWGQLFVFVLSMPQMEAYLWLLPFGLLLTGVQQIFTSWASYRHNVQALARVRISQVLGQNFIQIVLSSLGAAGLLLGFALSRLAGSIALIRDVICQVSQIRPSSWWALAYKFRAFPVFNVWAALLDTVGLQMVPLLFAKLFSTDVAGFYGLAARVVALPGFLVGQAVGQVFYPEASRQRGRPEALAKLVASSATALLRLGAPIFGLFFLCAPTLFGLVFGAQWYEAGEYARYLSLWLLLNFVSSPLSSFVLVAGKQRAALFFTMYEVALRLFAVWGGAALANPRLSVIFYALAGVIISGVYIGWVFRLAEVNFLYWLKSNIGYFGLFLLLILAIFVLRPLVSEGVFMVVAFSGMGLLMVISWPSLRRNLNV